MSTTVITALYNIEREQRDGRKFSDYLDWFSKTLQLNVPMVIFAHKGIGNWVYQQRQNYKNTTIVVETSLDSIPYSTYYEKVEKILINPEYLAKIDRPDRIECNLPWYNLIQYSKFDWLSQVAKFNPYNSDYFIWMDAGCSRFFGNVDITKAWPHPYGSFLQPGKINIQGNSNTYQYLLDSQLMDNYIYNSNCLVVGTMFGMSKVFTQEFAIKVRHDFDQYLLHNVVNNEQILLGTILNNHPELFNLYIKLDGTHLPFFERLSV